MAVMGDGSLTLHYLVAAKDAMSPRCVADGDFVAVNSEIATTCGERGTAVSRSESLMSAVSEGCAVRLSSMSDAAQRCASLDVVDPDGHSSTPTIAPLNPSLAEISLCSVGEAEQPVQLPVVTDLVFHRTNSSSDICEGAREFSSLSVPHIIQNLCRSKIPGWAHLDLGDIHVDQLLYGLSNQLFKVHIREDYPGRARFAHPNVLFRIYGKDVNSLYDSVTELKVFKKLGQRGVAPHLLAEFEGGRIEEWIEGGALLVTDMDKPSVLIGVASIMAGIHMIDLSKYLDLTPCVDKYLERWREGAMEIHRTMSTDHPSYLAVQRLDLPHLYEESFRLRKYLFPEGIPENEVTRLTFCHNDIQENNIMLTQTCMRLIDFEYSGYNYPAFDIASYFWETTCDYCVNAYPFFRIDPTKYPLVEKRRLFCAMYLTKLTRSTVKTSYVERLNPILDAVERFQLAIHMLWGFWSVIRAPQAATATSFDMLIDAYWAQKAKLIAQGKIRC